MYREITSSLVPGTLPDRRRRGTANGPSLRSAPLGGQLLELGLHLLMVMEHWARRVRFADGVLNGLDLPLLDVQILFNGLACKVRFGTVRRLGEFFEASLHLGGKS